MEIDQRELLDRVVQSTGLSLQQLADLLGLSLRTLQKIKYRDVPLTDRNRKQLLTIEASYREGYPITGHPKRDNEDIQDWDNSPRSHLLRAMERAGLDAGKLARLMGDDSGEVQAVLQGNAWMTEVMAEKIAAVVPGVTVDLLLSGADNPRVTDESGVTGSYGAKPNIATPPGMRVRYVPLLSWAQAGAMKAYTDEAYGDEAILTVDLPCANAFALRLRGKSMQPRLNEGDVVIVCADWQPRTGDVVVLKLTNGDVMCKYYHPTDGGARVKLTSENADRHPEVTHDRADIVWIYPVQSVVQTLRQRD